MKATVHPGRLSGRVAIPGSKSHTIRALLVASLAAGESLIRGALDSEDTAACIRILRDLGVKIDDTAPGGTAPGRKPGDGLALRVVGRSGVFDAPAHPLDCANSGTTLYLALSLAALQGFPVSFTGDEQLQRRSAGPLLRALESAGARVTREGTGDCVPLTVRGPLEGGEVVVECPTSQYLSSLLLAAPLSKRGLDIRVPLLNERPYVELTLSWLESQSIAYSRDGWDRFTVPGGQAYRAFDRLVPADFSSATFFLVAGALSNSPLEITGLDMNDSQGDRGVVRVLERLGCRVNVDGQLLTIAGPAADEPPLAGGDVDLNAMPDALPALAVLGTRCATPLRLVNVPQAREKETDRIAVMARAITTLGGRAEELPDGLVVHPSELAGSTVDSAGDHRVAMALAIAGLVASAPVTITNAGVAGITFPGFYEKLAACGARVEEA
ncbi:MAG TPA: 3-phosphoshikimate 1-carboxyvinyltransferase [Spirochaetia bacterium]|nr:3-phosphoshikimate 1-carboxyvinyltransferase [Spirochaetia bacterium]